MDHIATFTVSGQYGCVLLSTKRESLQPLVAPVADGSAWKRDIKQVDDAAFWYGFGSDAVQFPVSIYTAFESDVLPISASRTLQARFVSQGECVFLHGITDDGFRPWTPSFYLSAGRYRIIGLAWDLSTNDDAVDDYLPALLRFERHDIVFVHER